MIRSYRDRKTERFANGGFIREFSGFAEQAKGRSTLSYGWTGALIERCQQTLDAASRGEPVDEALRDLTDRFDKLEARRNPVALAHIADLHRRLSFVNNRNHEARTSVSWRLTRPLRGFAHLGALISGHAP